jgi:serine protease Do
MKAWKMAALVAALMTAAGIGAAMTPVAHGQAKLRAIRAMKQSPRALEILSGGTRIGVSVRDLDDGDAKSIKGATTGVVVDDVSTDSPAEKAGIRKGDVFVEFDGERVRSVRQFMRLVQETPAGRTVQAAVMREGQRTTVSITPREGNARFSFDGSADLADWARDFSYRVAPRAPTPPTPPTPPSPPSVWRFDDLLGRSSHLGISVDNISGQLAEYFGTKEGVLVTSVTDNSPAAKAGLKAGDVITSVNGSSINDPADLRRRVQSLTDGDEFTIAVMRDRKPLTIKGKIERTEPRRTFRTIL